MTNQPCHEKLLYLNLLNLNPKGVDQTAHLRSLISNFVIHFLDSKIAKHTMQNFTVKLSILCSQAGWIDPHLVVNL